MELEIGIEDLLQKNRVESNRIEYKEGWNPDDIYHSICAFANDYDNNGGGYIIIGVKTDENGLAMRPVKGVSEESVDSIQQEMVGYNNLLSPMYFPKVIKEEVDGKTLLVLWVQTGLQRPYKVPVAVTAKQKRYEYYIRYGTSTVRASQEQELELVAMTDRTPFDIRANHNATYDDISPALLEDHLKKTGSRLTSQVRQRGVEAILNELQLLSGPPEARLIQNVAIMMFCEYPERFFPYSFVQMTAFPGGSVSRPGISEDFPDIHGSVPQMIQEVLQRFQTNVIRSKVIKVRGQAESVRIYNYPYEAIEEAVVNAFYHRDFMSAEPVTIEIEPDCINIMNFPGIDRSISDSDIAQGKRFVSRYYRNRRLGEFLKELELSEGHSTGIPTMQEALERNGSPKATFHTDSDRRATRVQIPIHPEFAGKYLSDLRSRDLRVKDQWLREISEMERNYIEAGINMKKLALDESSEESEGEFGRKLKEVRKKNGISSEETEKGSEEVRKNREIGSEEMESGFGTSSEENDDSRNNTQQKILEFIRNEPTVTAAKMASALSISSRAVEKQIKALRENGVIIRRGANKGGHWEIV